MCQIVGGCGGCWCISGSHIWHSDWMVGVGRMLGLRGGWRARSSVQSSGIVSGQDAIRLMPSLCHCEDKYGITLRYRFIRRVSRHGFDDIYMARAKESASMRMRLISLLYYKFYHRRYIRVMIGHKFSILYCIRTA